MGEALRTLRRDEKCICIIFELVIFEAQRSRETRRSRLMCNSTKDVKETGLNVWNDSHCFELDSVAHFCEPDTELSKSINGREFSHQLSVLQLLKDSAPWSSLVFLYTSANVYYVFFAH
jgi:hypothetical protein